MHSIASSRFLGHRVISDNHLGDWGTQFGMIIYGYKHFADDEALSQATRRRADSALQAGQFARGVSRHSQRKAAGPGKEARRHRAATGAIAIDAGFRRSKGCQGPCQATATVRSTVERSTVRDRRIAVEGRSRRQRSADEQAGRRARRHRSASAPGNGAPARRRSDESRALAQVPARLSGRDRSYLRAARRHVRSHARRKFLSGPAARRRERPRRQRAWHAKATGRSASSSKGTTRR